LLDRRIVAPPAEVERLCMLYVLGFFGGRDEERQESVGTLFIERRGRAFLRSSPR
jgi:hypothetical protein